MEAMAYTWFNRFVAIRFMELHGYLDHGYRVLSHPKGKLTPEILEHAEHVDLPGLKKGKVIDLKLAGTKESELYRLLLTAQCNALKPIQQQMVILGSMSLGGNIVPVENLAESLQVAFDAGAKRLLLPMASVKDIPTIPGELFAKFQTGFYADASDAVFKAMGWG